MKMSERGKKAAEWWRGLQPELPSGKPNWKADRAALARLRHMGDPAEAMVDPVVIRLYRDLGFDQAEAAAKLEWVAAAAVVMAHVRRDSGRHPARAVGPSDQKDEAGVTALMKPLRFKRLMLSRTSGDVARQMRRLVALAETAVDVGRLAQSIIDWDDGERGDKCRVDWIFTYYDAEPSAPNA